MTQVNTSNMSLVLISETNENNEFDIMPPSPPIVNELSQIIETQSHSPGNFDYIGERSSREMIHTAYHAVNTLELWQYMKRDTDSYMISNDREFHLIMNKIEKLGFHGHSGCSYAWALRQIQFIAQHGEIAFKKLWLENV